MMKLAKIEHYRCGEPTGRWGTYVWVPEGWDTDTLQQYVDAAIKSYLNAEAEFKKLAPVSAPGYGASITAATPDTKTVKELRGEHTAALAAYAAYTEKVNKARLPFAHHLKEVSGGAVRMFWEKTPDLDCEAGWGHNHGVTIEYSETVLKDYPSEGEDDYV